VVFRCFEYPMTAFPAATASSINTSKQFEARYYDVVAQCIGRYSDDAFSCVAQLVTSMREQQEP
jgi:hypothetical protein